MSCASFLLGVAEIVMGPALVLPTRGLGVKTPESAVRRVPESCVISGSIGRYWKRPLDIVLVTDHFGALLPVSGSARSKIVWTEPDPLD